MGFRVILRHLYNRALDLSSVNRISYRDFFEARRIKSVLSAASNRRDSDRCEEKIDEIRSAGI